MPRQTSMLLSLPLPLTMHYTLFTVTVSFSSLPLYPTTLRFCYRFLSISAFLPLCSRGVTALFPHLSLKLSVQIPLCAPDVVLEAVHVYQFPSPPAPASVIRFTDTISAITTTKPQHRHPITINTTTTTSSPKPESHNQAPPSTA